ncbi:large ribosomal subunit protein uL10z-like, partial [Cicer arietinum]|uniref:large ribosomal subunit protein uL10z-like n=1 Tax=Cicer arietinum TaxID=3827 RepID=UPI003CC696D6
KNLFFSHIKTLIFDRSTFAPRNTNRSISPIFLHPIISLFFIRKINKGTVEIITPVELIKKGDKVGSSEAALLAKLGIRPFSYGLVVLSVYDNGSVFTPEVLNVTEDALIEKFTIGVSVVTSLSLAISYLTLAAAPHMFVNAYKNVFAVAVATEYSFPEDDKVKEFLKDPSKFAVAVVASPAADSGTAPSAAAKEEEKKDELMV